MDVNKWLEVSEQGPAGLRAVLLVNGVDWKKLDRRWGQGNYGTRL